MRKWWVPCSRKSAINCSRQEVCAQARFCACQDNFAFPMSVSVCGNSIFYPTEAFLQLSYSWSITACDENFVLPPCKVAHNSIYQLWKMITKLTWNTGKLVNWKSFKVQNKVQFLQWARIAMWLCRCDWAGLFLRCRKKLLILTTPLWTSFLMLYLPSSAIHPKPIKYVIVSECFC